MADSSITQALADLRLRREQIDRAIVALEALEGETSPAYLSGTAQGQGHASAEINTRVRVRGAGGGVAGAERVLRSLPDTGLTPRELAAGMLDNGWVAPSNPPNAARAAANRLVAMQPDEFFFEGGKFIFRPAKAAGDTGVQSQLAPQASPPGR